LGIIERDLFLEVVSVEIIGTIAEVAGKRFFDYGELVVLQCRNRSRFVNRRRCADVYDVNVIEHLFQGIECADAALLGIRRGPVFVNIEYALNFDVCAVNELQGFKMKGCGKA